MSETRAQQQARTAGTHAMLQRKATDSIWWLTMVDPKSKREVAIAYGEDYSVSEDKGATVYTVRGLETLQTPPPHFDATLTLCKTGKTAIGMKLTCLKWGSRLSLVGATDGAERVRIEVGK
jgi:hypothetical protein